jgi:hypothetical protein
MRTIERAKISALEDELRTFERRGALQRLGAHAQRAAIEATLAAMLRLAGPQTQRKVA